MGIQGYIGIATCMQGVIEAEQDSFIEITWRIYGLNE